MSDSSHAPTSPPDIKERVKEVFMWRKRLRSAGVVLMSTFCWAVMQLYNYNFLTIASWISIFLLSSLFIWANLLNILRKEKAETSGVEISESTAVGMANSARELAEEATRLMFKVGAQSEWYVFAGTVAGLWLLSILGSTWDFLTLLYIGIMMGMTVPVIWSKYDHKIREYGKRLQMQSKRFYSVIDERIVQKVMNKVSAPQKEKKVE